LEQPTARFCSNCGTPLSPDARFCHVCGAAVVASPVAAGIRDTESTSFAPPTYQPPQAEPSPQSPQTWPDSMPVTSGYASFGERFIAYMIDTIILTLGFWAVGFILVVIVLGIAGSSDAAEITLGFTVAMMVIAAHWLYFALQESSAKQATFGKRAMKIVVTDDQGKRLTFARASGRAFARLLSSMFFSIGYLLALFTARKQALHDLIASTVVLRR